MQKRSSSRAQRRCRGSRESHSTEISRGSIINLRSALSARKRGHSFRYSSMALASSLDCFLTSDLDVRTIRTKARRTCLCAAPVGVCARPLAAAGANMYRIVSRAARANIMASVINNIARVAFRGRVCRACPIRITIIYIMQNIGPP